MDGADLCFEIVKRANMGFVYSEAVTRLVLHVFPSSLLWLALRFVDVFKVMLLQRK